MSDTTHNVSDLVLNDVLAFSQGNGSPTQTTDHPCPIHWDLRESSVEARLYGDPNRPLTFGHLVRPATYPMVDSLDITCGFFENWPIHIRRPEGITVNVLVEAIRSTLLKRISRAEWQAFSPSQQARIEAAFDARWKAAEDPSAAHAHGILRLDCLQYHTIFAGLSLSLETSNTCILTLRRRPQQPRPQPEQ